MDDTDRDPIDVLAEEFADRYRRGERPSVREFAALHPQWSEQLLTVLPSVAKLEELKGARSSASRELMSGNGSSVSASSHSASASAPVGMKLERLGDFHIVRKVGGGGMGIVYEAMQESLGRRVAVKVLPKHAVAEKHKLARFRREAQAASRLHHSNIVPVYGVGEHDGIHYYTMQFIDGHGLNEIIGQWRREASARAAECESGRAGDGNRAPFGTLSNTHAGTRERCRQIAAIGVQAAEALHYAHRQGTLHRDVKPSNLLLDERGIVWVADFGLAKWLEKPGLTDVGELVGTLQYLAPECMHVPADARADVYSLGLTLYELLVLKPAFEARHPAALIKQLKEYHPPRPRSVNPAIPRDLEAVVLKAMARDPHQRYQTAGELATDLQRYLDSRPVLARHITSAERLWRWSRRNRLVASLAAMLMLVLVSGFAAVLWMWREAVAEYTRAEEHLQTAQNALRREATERGKAQTATQRAELNVQLSLQALEEIFDTIAPEEVGLTRRGSAATGFMWAGSEEEAAMLQAVLNFFEQFAQQNDTDPKLQMEAANAYRRVGNLRARLGQNDKAELAYRRAAAMLEKLATAYPENPGYRYELAETYARVDFRLLDYRSSSIDPAALTEAVKRLRQALSLAESLNYEAPATADYAALVARVQARLGILLQRLDRGEEAERAIRQAIELRTKLTADNPDVTWYAYEAAHAKRLLADCICQQQEKSVSSGVVSGDDSISANDHAPLTSQHARKLIEARSLLEASIEELLKISRTEPRFGSTNMALASAYHSLATVLNRLGDTKAAEEANRSSDRFSRMGGTFQPAGNRNPSTRQQKPMAR